MKARITDFARKQLAQPVPRVGVLVALVGLWPLVTEGIPGFVFLGVLLFVAPGHWVPRLATGLSNSIGSIGLPKAFSGNPTMNGPAGDVGSRMIVRYKGKSGTVTLYNDRLKAGGVVRPVTASLTATADAAGNTASRGTPGAAATLGGWIGLLFMQSDRKHRKYDKKHYDKRELYLVIEDSAWGTVIECSPDDGLKVRDLARQINLAARLATSLPREESSR